MNTLVFDYDYVKFAAACVAEKRDILVVHKQSGREKIFNNRTEFYGHYKKKEGGWLAEINKKRDVPFLVEEFDIYDQQHPEPVANALMCAKLMIEGVCQKLDSTNYYGYIGKGDSWRVARSNLSGYKQNRTDLIRPLLLEDVEEYLVKYHSASKVYEIEADDKVIMDAWENKNKIVVAIDKDAMGCEVKVFNPDKMDTYQDIKGLGNIYLDGKGEVRGYGRKFFYYQTCFGDNVDHYFANAQSEVKWGEKSAYNALVECKTDKECWQSLVNVYSNLYPEPVTFTSWKNEKKTMTALDCLQEIVDMAHMWRWEDDLIIVPDVLNRLKIKYD